MRLQPRGLTWSALVGRWIRLSSLAIAVALAGCCCRARLSKACHAHARPVSAAGREKAAQSTTAAIADLTQWWRILHDRELDSLVARARESNLDLAIALDRLQEARTGVTIAASQALPVVGATGGGGVGTGSDETKGRVSQALRSAENAQNLQQHQRSGRPRRQLGT